METAVAYKTRLGELSTRISDVVKAKEAIKMSNLFTFDNSLAKGRKMSNDLGKLMLRAYNAEVDNSLRSLRAGNVLTAKKRVKSARAAIAKLGQMMEMHISDAFHNLRFEEIELTADYLMKKQEACPLRANFTVISNAGGSIRSIQGRSFSSPTSPRYEKY